MIRDSNRPHWPYPTFIAHRGGGGYAPENTLAAFRVGAAHGARMFECDVKLSADGVPFLLHDATLDRTTDGQGAAAERTFTELSHFGAGRHFSDSFAGEPIPSLAQIIAFCLEGDFQLNIEIKPSPGLALETGLRVAALTASHWQKRHTLPLLTSFDATALEAARDAAPHLPRGLLLNQLSGADVETALALGCMAVILEQSLCSSQTFKMFHDHGLAIAVYTVNDKSLAHELLTLGAASIITDEIVELIGGC